MLMKTKITAIFEVYMKKYSVTILTLILLTLVICAPLNNNPKEIFVDDMLSKMTLEEKIGQMTQVDYSAFEDFNDIEKYAIGSVLWGGGSEISDITPQGWANVSDQLQTYAGKTRLKIPLLFGIDAVHGHNNVDGAVIFPHNIGLGCTQNPELIEKSARATAEEIAGTGIHWTFAPCVAVARNERWGRTYESFSEDPELVAKLGAAAVKGFENGNLSAKDAVLSCTKHYMGDGGTTNGKDQGHTEVDEETLRKIHLPGYIQAIKENTGSIMASYNTWDGIKMHGNKYLLTDVLKNELGFKGFIVSDWAAIDQLPGDYKSDIEICINAGMDMIMIPNGPREQGVVEETDNGPITKNTYFDFIKYTKELVEENKIPMSRIDDAVTRILNVKYDLDLFNKLTHDKELLSKIGSKEHRDIAKECVRESLVLLKNENNTLPVSKSAKRIHLAGTGADNIGMQCGGWTISWQGEVGDVISGGTTILDAFKNSAPEGTEITYSEDASNAHGADYCIVVVGEKPYAEMFGDRENLALSEDDINVIKIAKDSGAKVIVVLLSGRPLIINSALELADAFVAAWLPGSEGQGVADVLFGDYNFKGRLSHSWPKDMSQIPVNKDDENYDPLFKINYGLCY